MTIALLGFAIFLLHCATCEKPLDGILSSSAWHFTHSHYNATIYENSSPKTYVESFEKMGIYLAEPQWAVRYRIISGDVANVFKTEEYVVGNFCFLRIRTKSSNTALLNREVRESYTLIIQATEKTLELEALTRVVVHILDQNDLKPLFSPPSYRVTISEDTPLKSPICKVTATDADLGQNAEFYYNFNTRSEMFAIHPTSGVVTVAGKLNVTWRGKHELQVLAVDRMRKISEGNGFGSLAALVVHVEPALRKPPAIASVVVTPLDSNDGTTYATVLVDVNSSGAEVESVEVVGGDPGKHFKAIKSYARSNEFSLVSVKDINWMEYLHGFNLSLQARSGSGPYFYSQIRGFHLPPSKLASLKFEKAVYRVQLSEFSPPGSRVVMVRVTPAFPNLQYVLKSSSENLGFKLNARTGLITTTKLMDFHDRAHYQLHIRTSPGQASTVVVIDIVDCNNHAPIFNRSSYDGTLDENIPPGTSVLAVTATDQDHRENGYVTYSIAGPKALPFSIDPYLGIISTSKPMDYELMKRIYTFRVRASDWGSPFRREKEVSIFLQLRNLNDNQPMFEEVNCTGSIRQDWPVGKSIMTMSAIDVDELQNLKYEIVSGNELEYFDLNHFSGVISLKRSFTNLTAGQPASYSLKITASDGKHYASPTTLNITVVKDPHFEVPITCDKTGVLTQFTKTILHSIGLQNQESGDEEFTSLSTYQINHYTPQFEDHFPQSIDVLESVPVNTSLARLAATDPDAGFNGKLVYVIADGNEEGCFDIKLETGLLTIAAPLDYETTNFYILNVTVYDLGTPQKSSWKLLTVNVKDWNDNAPRFPPGGYQLTISEDTEVGTTIAELTTKDADSEDNGRVRYTLLSPTEKFSLHPLTGELVITGHLDRESEPRYILKVEARDQPRKGHQLFSVTDLMVTLEDVNDNSPQCITELNRLKVPEDLPPGTVLTFLDASDPDLGPAGEVRYVLMDDAHGTFRVDLTTGALSLERELDFERRAGYNLSLWASDSGRPLARRTLCHVEVIVLDVNENLQPPHFASFVHQGQVQENSPSGTQVMVVAAHDDDSGLDGELQYFLRAGTGLAAFSINQDTGMIQTLAPLDREFASYYWLTVLAVDRGSVPLSSVTEVYIEVTDANDNPPQMSQAVFYPSIQEDAPVGTSVLQLDASDPDSSSKGKLTFNITSGNHMGFFIIHPVTGLLSTARQLDRENKDEHILEVTVLDNGEPPLKSTSRVVVGILDVNDNPPAFSHKLFNVRLPERLSPVSPGPVYRLVASDLDEGLNGRVTYSIEESDEEGFSIDPVTGVVSSSSIFTAGEYNILTIKATDNGQPPLSASVRLHIEWIPRPRPSSIPLAFDETHYSFTVMETDPVNHMVGVISVEGRPGLFWFNISGGDKDMDFDIEKTTGSIIIARPLDTRRRSSYDLTVEVTDGSHTITTQVHIFMIANINHHRPQFLETHYEVRVPQDTLPGVELLQVQAIDQDKGKGLIYTIHGSQDPGSASLFQLDPSSGVLVTVGKLDLGSGPSQHTLTVMVRDQEIPIKRNFVWVTIHVENGNLHPPRFTQLHYEASVPDTTAPGTELLQVRAMDADRGANAEVRYSLLKGNGEGFFNINALLGIITLTQKLDWANHVPHTLTVKAEDQGSPQWHDLATVIIHVYLSDRSAPIFSNTEYFVEIPESIPVGSPILLVSAMSSSEVTYELREGNKDGVFSMNSYSGLISTQKNLDHEKISSYQLKIRGSNMAEGDPLGQFGISQVGDEWRISSRKTLDREHMAKYLLRVTASDGKFQASVTVEIFVLDVNDNSPQCSQLLYTGKVHEDVFPGHFILKVSATDLDADTNAQITYSLHGPGAHEFKLDPHTGELTTLTPLDRERKDVFNLVAKATDGGGRSCQADVTLHVEDVNDNAPRFFPSHCAVAVFDNTTVKTPVAVVFARDPDQGPNAQVVYSLPDSAEGHFSIDATTGVIRLEKPLQVRPQAPLELTVRASDLGTPIPLSTLGTVTVSVVGLEDYLPVFLNTEHSVQVPEDAPPGTEVLQLATLTRPGAEKTGYRVVSGNEQGRFRLDAHTGILYVNASLDFETSPKYFLSIECIRKSSSSLSDVTTVVVNITDVNEHRPRFPQDPYRTRVLENALVGDVILTVSATDEDGPLNSDITYSLVGGNQLGHFTIHPKKGELQVAKALDWEQASSYSLKLRATDSGQPPLHEDTDIAIQVADVNDNPPRFFQLNYSTTVQENSPIGSKVLQLILSDPDSPENGPPYSFRITKGNNGSAFRVTPDGWLVTAEGLSRRAQEWYQLQIQASDSGIPPLSSSTSVRVHVTEKSHYAPSALPLEIFITVGEEEFQGGMVGKIHATDRDPQDTLTYSLAEEETLGRYFSVGAPDGKIIASQSLPRGRYSFNVTVSDGTFTTTAGVHVYVWHVGREALQQAVWMGFYQLTPEELVSDHWRNLQRFLSHKLDIKRANIHLASLQPAEAVAGVDVLLVFEGHSGTFYELQELASIIIHSAKEMEHAVGVQMRSAMPVVPCQGPTCQGQICHDTVHMDPKVGPTYSTARLSILTPRHRLQRSCSCNGTAARFSGQSYVQYRPPAARNWHISFYLKTLQPQAILLFTNETASISLKLASGVLQLEYHCLGGFYGNLSSQRHVNDHEWHSILVEEMDTSIRLMVDSMGNTSLVVPENCRGLRPERHLLLGGLVLSHSSFNVSQGFEGCLDAVVVNEEALELLVPDKTVAGLLETQALTQCCPQSNYCSQNPCLNGGKCSWTHGAGYVCKCPPPFSGKHCEQGRENCTFAPCLEGGTCIPSPKGASCNCPHPYTGDRCEMEARGCSEGHCLVTPEIKRGDWGQQELLIIVVTIVFIIISTVGLLYYCRRCKSHKPVAMEDPDLLARSVGVDTQAMPAIELNPLSASSCNNLNQPEPSKTSVPNELVTFAPNSKQRPVVCSVPPRLPPAAVPSHSDNEPVIKRTWSGEEMVYPGGATVWPPTYSRNERWEYPHSEVTHGPLPPSTHRHSTPVVMPEPAGLYGGFPFPLEMENKRAPLPPRYSNQNLEDLMPSRPPSPRERLLAPCLNEYTAISYYHSQFRQGGGGPSLAEGGYKGVSMRLSRAGPSYAVCEVEGAPLAGQGQPRVPPNYEGSDMVESDYGSCEEVMF
nr:protocadherin Fat 2 isoform X3 [Aotus nancymaae]